MINAKTACQAERNNVQGAYRQFNRLRIQSIDNRRTLILLMSSELTNTAATQVAVLKLQTWAIQTLHPGTLRSPCVTKGIVCTRQTEPSQPYKCCSTKPSPIRCSPAGDLQAGVTTPEKQRRAVAKQYSINAAKLLLIMRCGNKCTVVCIEWDIVTGTGCQADSERKFSKKPHCFVEKPTLQSRKRPVLLEFEPWIW